jgi:hypothetical protein
LLTSLTSNMRSALGGDGRKEVADGLEWCESFWLAGGFDRSACRRSALGIRLKRCTVEGELPKVRSTPSGCLALTRRAVGMLPEETRNAVPVDDVRDEARVRPGTGESGAAAPNGASSRFMCCIREAGASDSPSPEGMRASLRLLAVWRSAGATVPALTVSKVQSSDSSL